MSSNQNPDKFQIYSSNLLQLFEKIGKNIPKKNPYYNDILKFCKDLPGLLAKDQSDGPPYNADKYFVFFQKSLDVDNLKVIEAFLEHTLVLIMYDLLNGKSDYIKIQSNTDGTGSPTVKYSLHKKKLIDNIIDCIGKIFNINDENIWLHIIKLLYVMFKNQNIAIHNESLIKIFRICLRIYLQSRTNLNKEKTKNCFNHILTHLFTKMESLNSGFHEREASLVKVNSYETYSTGEERSNRSMVSDFGLTTSSFKLFVQKNPLEDLVSRIIKNTTDMVCIYDFKCKSIVNDLKSKNLDENSIPPMCDLIPLSACPPTPEAIVDDKKYKYVYPTSCLNERGEQSGWFGWCFQCRRAADFYCKETRMPVCSLECKKKIRVIDEKADKFASGESANEIETANLYLVDCVNIFKSLCRLNNTNVSTSNETTNYMSKLLALELIQNILEKPGLYFQSNPEFLRIVKEELMEGLLKNCTSDDVNLFQMSLGVFSKIWLYFRESLKPYISVFIEKVFLKILDSSNSSYHHKLLVLDFFHKNTVNAKFYIELYVNYDSDLNEKDLLNRVVNVLSKISQGKGNKHDSSILPQQEYNLRSKALEIVTFMTRAILQFLNEQGMNLQNRLFGENNKGEKDNNINDVSEYLDNDDGLNSFFESSVIDMREKLEQNRKIKNYIQVAVEKFNIKPKNGINYLRKSGIINKDNEVAGIAEFLRSGQNLKKEMMGDYLGELNDLCLKVLDYYTYQFDFTNLHLVEAIRLFLSYFQLPGESQKIDRIMQKFAEKYYKDNPGLYANADCAYYLSFATIMLQTDTHNPGVKHKMGIEGFSKMCNGINGGKNLERAYLEDIYQQILKKPISLVEHEEAKDKMDTQSTKQDLFKKESERMFLEGSQQLKMGNDKSLFFVINNETDQIGPLMASLWTALLAMYSILMEETEDINICKLCTEGFENCIKLCGMTGLDLQKEALFKGFSKHTNLLNGKEIKDKNILCIRSILSLARDEGRHLGGTWKFILELVSKIDFYQIFISGSKLELENFANEIRSKKKGPHAEKEIAIEKINIERIGKEITQEEYEVIFSRTEYLDQNSIIDFVKSLCEVSSSELSGVENKPRIFSLQKLVEVAEFNMGRIQIEWSKIWSIISEHLTEVGSNSNPIIAEKAVDSLRQLAKKFLQRDEITIYQFQKEFLKPFQDILVNNINVYRTKEYVITCIANLVLIDAASIKSGWRIIFNIFQMAADDTSPEIVKKTFDTLEKVFKKHFQLIKENFPELAHCLKKFSNHYPDAVIKLFLDTGEKLEDQNQMYAVISSMGSIITNQNEDIRKNAYEAFFKIISKLHKAFNQDIWRQVFKVTIQPVIDDLKASRYFTTLEDFLRGICRLFSEYYSKLEFLLSSFFNEIVSLSTSDNETIALIGIDTIKYFIEQLHDKMSDKIWESLLKTIAVLFKNTQQTDLIEFSNEQITNSAMHQDTQILVNKNIVYCIVQHNLIDVCNLIIDNYFDKLKKDNINSILECLKESIYFAYEFNCMFELRKTISENFMPELKQSMALYKQHKDGVSCYYNLLLKINTSCTEEEKSLYNNELIEFSLKILKQFVERINYNNERDFILIENERLINNMVHSVKDNVIPGLIELKFVDKISNLDDFIKVFLELIMCNILDIRVQVKEVLTAIFEKNTRNLK